MEYKADNITEKQLFNYIFDNAKEKEMIILGGHFLLLYDDIDNKLAPSIWQEQKHQHLVQTSKILAGEFPISSFEFALDLVCARSKLTQIALLVNDHYYQTNYFNRLAGGKLFEHSKFLRHDYYHKAQIPLLYFKLIVERNIEQENIFIKNTLTGSSNYHPYLFSETSLRKKFDKKLKKELAQFNSFSLEMSNSKTELFFHSDNKNSFCFTDNGSCGCSGEVFQFICELSSLKTESIVLLVPQECYESVCMGIEAVISYFQSKMLLNNIAFFVVSGFGDNKYLNVLQEDNYKISHFSYR